MSRPTIPFFFRKNTGRHLLLVWNCSFAVSLVSLAYFYINLTREKTLVKRIRFHESTPPWHFHRGMVPSPSLVHGGLWRKYGACVRAVWQRNSGRAPDQPRPQCLETAMATELAPGSRPGFWTHRPAPGVYPLPSFGPRGQGCPLVLPARCLVHPRHLLAGMFALANRFVSTRRDAVTSARKCDTRHSESPWCRSRPFRLSTRGCNSIVGKRLRRT